ncbi:MAG TPA: hypothetical protein VHN99_07880 [Deinococcales bacterium]|nr:hypothetical protein [Deinococcales bacterium]
MAEYAAQLQAARGGWKTWRSMAITIGAQTYGAVTFRDLLDWPLAEVLDVFEEVTENSEPGEF